ncbi:MAG: arylsulfatase A [Limisphaerales bacterium]|jgi:arylsulfatase A
MHRFMTKLAMAFVLTGTFSLSAAAPLASKPNLIVIMTDDMGYGDAGCYGGTAFPTPHIDRLAEEGLRFTDFHSSGPVCSPTRAGLLTGRYQQRAGVPGVIYAPFNRNRHHGLQLSEVTFAEVLKDHGYATGAFGKWHLGYQEQYNPTRQGFDRYVGYVSGNVDFHTHIDGAGVFDWWHDAKHNREEGYTTHLITRHATRFIRENKDKPFCVYIAHEAPHDPYQGPGDPPVRKEGDSKLIYNHRDPKHAARAYREMMIEMDKGVGEVMSTVRQLGLAKNTFILFFSDNGATGPGSCGGLYGMKGSLWEGGHRVPCIAWWPGRIKAGAESDQLAFSIDVMPTILDIAGAKPPPDRPLDGQSLAPLLFKNQLLGNRQLFWQYNDAVTMRDGDWKLILNGGKPNKNEARYPNIDWNRPNDGRETVALFNLKKDKQERRNLAEKQRPRVAAMKTAIKLWQADVARGATKQPEK